MQFCGMIINNAYKIVLNGNEVQLDVKNTSVAQIFGLLNYQLTTDFDLRNHGDDVDGSKLEIVKLTPKEQMEQVMEEVVAQQKESFQRQMNEMKTELVADIKRMQQNTVSSLMTRQDKMESYVDSVHSDFLKANERQQEEAKQFMRSIKATDTKMEVVINIEQNH
jgi:hypothetical protein